MHINHGSIGNSCTLWHCLSKKWRNEWIMHHASSSLFFLHGFCQISIERFAEWWTDGYELVSSSCCWFSYRYIYTCIYIQYDIRTTGGLKESTESFVWINFYLFEPMSRRKFTRPLLGLEDNIVLCIGHCDPSTHRRHYQPPPYVESQQIKTLYQQE